jgi:hypothetical protein
MDANGARLLAARIRAGVPVGAVIELIGKGTAGLGLKAGDRGVVSDITSDGRVTVAWDRGFSLAIDPESTPFRPL